MPKASTPRGEDKRRRILEGTLDVIATEGVRAVTHRRVATQANASVGLIAYYFASTEALITAALEDLAEREAERFRALRVAVGSSAPGLDEVVDLLVGSVMESASTHRREQIAGMALTLEIPRNAVDRDSFVAWEAAQTALYEEVARSLGCEDVEETAMFLTATIDGLSLYAAITTDPLALRSAATTGLRRFLRSCARVPGGLL